MTSCATFREAVDKVLPNLPSEEAEILSRCILNGEELRGVAADLKISVRVARNRLRKVRRLVQIQMIKSESATR